MEICVRVRRAQSSHVAVDTQNDSQCEIRPSGWPGMPLRLFAFRFQTVCGLNMGRTTVPVRRIAPRCNDRAPSRLWRGRWGIGGRHDGGTAIASWRRVLFVWFCRSRNSVLPAPILPCISGVPFTIRGSGVSFTRRSFQYAIFQYEIALVPGVGLEPTRDTGPNGFSSHYGFRRDVSWTFSSPTRRSPSSLCTVPLGLGSGLPFDRIP